jgi:SM-20-related protein
MGLFLRYLNLTCYTGLNTGEFHYAWYDIGSFYKKHLDQFRTDSGRKYSIVVYLNENWTDEDGGQLLLYIGGKTIRINPEGGRIVFFESDKIEHEVLSSKRPRMSVTGWLKKV